MVACGQHTPTRAPSPVFLEGLREQQPFAKGLAVAKGPTLVTEPWVQRHVTTKLVTM